VTDLICKIGTELGCRCISQTRATVSDRRVRSRAAKSLSTATDVLRENTPATGCRASALAREALARPYSWAERDELVVRRSADERERVGRPPDGDEALHVGRGAEHLPRLGRHGAQPSPRPTDGEVLRRAVEGDAGRAAARAGDGGEQAELAQVPHLDGPVLRGACEMVAVLREGERGHLVRGWWMLGSG